MLPFAERDSGVEEAMAGSTSGTGRFASAATSLVDMQLRSGQAMDRFTAERAGKGNKRLKANGFNWTLVPSHFSTTGPFSDAPNGSNQGASGGITLSGHNGFLLKGLP